MISFSSSPSSVLRASLPFLNSTSFFFPLSAILASRFFFLILLMTPLAKAQLLYRGGHHFFPYIGCSGFATGEKEIPEDILRYLLPLSMVVVNGFLNIPRDVSLSWV